MFRVARTPALKRVLARAMLQSRTMAMETAKPSLTSLNAAAVSAQLPLDGTLEEVASTHFSESSAFPEFSPMEDTLLGQAVPRIKAKTPIMDAHALAEEQLADEATQRFSEASVFPEWTPVDEVMEQHKN